jgi:solute carrier family 25 phosphate transporter 23/24/25/41
MDASAPKDRKDKGRFWRFAQLAEVPFQMKEENAAHTFKVFLLGGIAGGIGKTVGSPFARLTIILQTAGMFDDGGPTRRSLQTGSQWQQMKQVMRYIWEKEGIRGLLRGNAVDIVRSVPFSGISYLCYETYKQWLREYQILRGKGKAVPARLIAGASAGVTAVALTYPLDLVRTHLCVHSNYKGFWDAFWSVVQSKGVRGLYSGLPAACLGVVPNLAISFTVFENTRDFLEEKLHLYELIYEPLPSHETETSTSTLNSRPPPPVLQRSSSLFISLCCGTLSTLCGMMATFPIEVVQRRLMLEGMPNRSQCVAYTGSWHCFTSIIQREGVRSLYRGLLPQLLRSIPVGAVTLGVYDYMKRAFNLELG